MNHITLQILQDLDINDESVAYKRIQDLSEVDINTILDKMDGWYKEEGGSISEKIATKKTVFDFWIPSPTSQSLSKLTSDLLFADTVVISDPLYDHLCFIDSGMHMGSIVKQKKALEGKHICNTCSQAIDSIGLNVSREKIAEIMVFYLRAKPLIENGTLIPYVSPLEAPWQLMEIPLIDIVKEFDDSVADFVKSQEKNQERVEEESSRSHHAVNEYSLPFLRTAMQLTYDKYLATVGVGDILLNPIAAPSVDFLENVSDGVFRGIVKHLGKLGAISSQSTFTPSTYENAFSLPALSGMPIQAIPEIVYKEKDSLEQFKASINSKLLTISEPLGTKEWEKQIYSIRAGLQRDLIELERTLNHIKHDHLRKQTENIALLGFSIALASLAFVNQTLDPITAITGVASGAGLTSSLKSIFDALIERQEKINEQKRKDVFFLWRLKQSHVK